MIKKGFSKSRQEDTHEFFRFVTDALQNTALCGLPKYAHDLESQAKADIIGTFQLSSSTRPGYTRLGEVKFDHESFVQNARNRQTHSTISSICHSTCPKTRKASEPCSKVSSVRTSWRVTINIIVKSMSQTIATISDVTDW